MTTIWAQIYTIELRGAFGYVGLLRTIGECVYRKRSFGDDVGLGSFPHPVTVLKGGPSEGAIITPTTPCGNCHCKGE